MTDDASPPEPPAEPERRMQLRGLHHVTAIVADLDRTTAFYRDVLGLALTEEADNADDPGSRHFWFGDALGTPGTLVSFMEYPQMDEAREGRGGVHHFAFGVGSAEEQVAWRDYLRERGRAVHGGLRARALPLDLLPRPGRQPARGRDGLGR